MGGYLKFGLYCCIREWKSSDLLRGGGGDWPLLPLLASGLRLLGSETVPSVARPVSSGNLRSSVSGDRLEAQLIGRGIIMI